MSDVEKDDLPIEASEDEASAEVIHETHPMKKGCGEGQEEDVKAEEPVEGDEDAASPKEEEEEEEEAPRKRLRRRVAEKATVAKKPKKERSEQPPKKTGGSGFSKPVKVSDELATFIGQNEISRPQLTKFMWAYFKENGLQDPTDKRHIISDDKLKHLLKVDRFNAFGFMKLVKPHFIG